MADPKTPENAQSPKKKRAPRRGLRLAAWLVGIILMGGAGYALLRSRNDVAVPVQTLPVARGAVRDFVSSIAAGRVSAKQEATVRAEIAGTVSVIRKRRGDTVQVGDPLFEYAPLDLTERVRLANASVGMAAAQVRQAAQSASVAETNLSRARHLLEAKAIGSAEVDTLEGQTKVAERAVESARAGVAQAQANAEIAKTAANKAIVRAPFAGTVIDVKVEVGEATSPGAIVVLLAETSSLHVDAEIDEADLAKVRVGMPADVSFDALPGERLRGKLLTIAPSVSRDARGGRSIAVDVELPQDPRLRVGMSADVDIIVAVHEQSLWVPPNAVIGRGAERGVYVVENAIAKRRVVEVGINTWEAVEITKGVNAGDQVISTLSAAKLADGVRVIATVAPASSR